ncbi:hypothetical protein GCM10027447_12280 [Glycomyces halotolerans]
MKLQTITQFAAQAGTTPAKARRWCRNGDVVAHKNERGHWVIGSWAPVPEPTPGERLRDAIADLEKTPGGWVSLDRLRAHLDMDRLDAVMVEEYIARQVRITSETNCRCITPAMSAAALMISGVAHHWICNRTDQ